MTDVEMARTTKKKRKNKIPNGFILFSPVAIPIVNSGESLVASFSACGRKKRIVS
jgi:hypothetical protein